MQARYQYGNLTIRQRRKGLNVWQFRWLENGRPKSVLIGTVEKYPARAGAERAVERLRIKVNAQNPQQQFHFVTVGALIDRFMEDYAPKHCRRHMQRNYRSLLETHIRPRGERNSSSGSRLSPSRTGLKPTHISSRSSLTFATSCTPCFRPRSAGR